MLVTSSPFLTGHITPAVATHGILPLFLPSFGVGELAILFVIVLILFGPGKLPDVCRALGDGLKQFKQATRDDHQASPPPTPPLPAPLPPPPPNLNP
jgi:sec-independent protein translocase protein TatA